MVLRYPPLRRRNHHYLVWSGGVAVTGLRVATRSSRPGCTGWTTLPAVVSFADDSVNTSSQPSLLLCLCLRPLRGGGLIVAKGPMTLRSQ